MKVFLLLASLFLVATALTSAERTKWFQLDSYSFEQYIKEYNKQYSSPQEHNYRKHVFEVTLKSVRQHNQDTTKSWKKGINHLSDRSEEEFKQLLGYKKHLAYASKANQQEVAASNVDISALPASVDWRTRNIITSVKDQGQCGSCWTFGTAESVESYFALATGVLVDLSEQQILDCTPNPNECGGTGGCEGGTPELAYQQIINLGGLASEWTYPYISYSGSNYQCHFNTTPPVVQLSGFKVLPSNQYAPVLQALATVGPLAVNVDASSWSQYESGVFDGCDQTNPDIDHVVQLVGYGTDTKFGDYWLIRNSWSPLWGEVGYIRIRRSEQPRCGIDLHPADGTGCTGGPPQVQVCGTCAILYDVSYPVIKQ